MNSTRCRSVLVLAVFALGACATSPVAEGPAESTPVEAVDDGSCEIGGKTVLSGYTISDGCNDCSCEDGSATCTTKACHIQVAVTLTFAPGMVEPSEKAKQALAAAVEALRQPAMVAAGVTLLRSPDAEPKMASERLLTIRVYLSEAGIDASRISEGIAEDLDANTIAVRTPLVDQPPEWGDPKIRR